MNMFFSHFGCLTVGHKMTHVPYSTCWLPNFTSRFCTLNVGYDLSFKLLKSFLSLRNIPFSADEHETLNKHHSAQ